jgi:hypothetical protein
MSTQNDKLETVKNQIYTHAGHLIGKYNYKELNPVTNYNQCDRLVINHNSKTFWFANEKSEKHTRKLLS